MNIQLVIFDMAGTTVRDNDAVNNCLRAALAEAGVSVDREEVNEVMGMPKPVAIQFLLDKHTPGAKGQNTVSSIHDIFLKTMIRYYEIDPEVCEIPGAENVFRSLRACGIKVALDTGFSRPILDAILKRLRWTGSGLLDTTVASDEVRSGRPAPDLIYEAMRRTGVTDPARVAKVGDTPSDLLEGRAAGCGFVIGAVYGSHTRAELESHPYTHLIDSIGEVTAVVTA